MVPTILLALALSGAALPPTDAQSVLATTKEAVAKLRSLHAVVKAEESNGGKVVRTRFVECWVDPKGGRVRTEVRRKGHPNPDLVYVAEPKRLRIRQLAVDEVAEQAVVLDLPTALAASFAGELLATTFKGDLMSFKVAAYGSPTLAPDGEPAAGVGCTRLHYGGNGEADLWIADGDHLPRRIRGPLGSTQLDETVVTIEPDANLGDVAFEIDVAEGRKVYEPREAAARWRALPPESERWPKVDEDPPDFAAADFDGEQHLLLDTAVDSRVAVVFWFDEDEASVKAAADFEKKWLARKDPKLKLVHVAAGDQRAPVEKAAKAAGITQPIWIAGRHEQNAFRQFRVWSCPLFVLMNDREMKAITASLDDTAKWFAE
jgi:hypothetical protein